MGDDKGTAPLAAVSQSIVSDTSPASSTTNDTPEVRPATSRPSLADALAAKPLPVESKKSLAEDKRPERKTTKKVVPPKQDIQDRVIERIKVVTDLGLKWNGQYESYVQDDINVAVLDLKTLSDEEFNKTIDSIKAEMERRSAK